MPDSYLPRLDPLIAVADFVQKRLGEAACGAVPISGARMVLIFGNSRPGESDCMGVDSQLLSRIALARDGFELGRPQRGSFGTPGRGTKVYTATPPEWMKNGEALGRCELAVWTAIHGLTEYAPDQSWYVDHERKIARRETADFFLPPVESFAERLPPPMSDGSPSDIGGDAA